MQKIKKILAAGLLSAPMMALPAFADTPEKTNGPEQEAGIPEEKILCQIPGHLHWAT